MLRLNKKHLSDLLAHLLGVTKVLSDAGCVPDVIPDEPEGEEPAAAIAPESIDEAFGTEGLDTYGAEPEAQPSEYSVYGNDEDSIRRMEAMKRLCGRWMTGSDNCDIEILRRGEHFIIRHIQRDGTPAGERYLLLWNCGEIY